VEPLTPIPAPAGHLGDLFVPAPGAAWTKVRAALGPTGLFLPQGFPALCATLVGLPITFAAEIDDAVPVVGAAARQGRGPVQVAIGIHVKSGDRFVDQLTRGEGARFNSTVDPSTRVTLLTDKVAPEHGRSTGVALGVLGNYLVVAPSPSDLYALGPYVVRTVGAAPAPRDDIAFEVPEKSLSGPLLDGVRELRAMSDGAVASVVPLAGALDAAATLLGDASAARLTVNLDAATVHGRMVVTPKPGGPGSKLVSELATGDTRPLLDLPDTVNLGLLWRESATARGENAPKQAEALVRLLGADVPAEDRAAISAALRGEAEARGDWQAVGVAFNGTGPTAVVRAPVTDADRMKKALKQLVDLGGLASFKKALAAMGVRLSTDRAVVENLAAEVTRVRLSRTDEPVAAATKDKGNAKKAPPASAPSAEAPRAIDLLYFVDGTGLFGAAGYDPKDSLRALVKAPQGANLGATPALAGALSSIGGDASFVLVADALRISAMTGGTVPPASSPPLVVAAGHAASPADFWARVDVPAAVVQQILADYTRRKTVLP
jgi:hypothetical protein